jgi:hypothetical protein
MLSILFILFTKLDFNITTTTMSGGFKLAQKSPTVAGKVCCICLGLIAGAGGITVKNVIGNVTSDIGKLNFIGASNLTDIINNMFNLTGFRSIKHKPFLSKITINYYYFNLLQSIVS